MNGHHGSPAPLCECGCGETILGQAYTRHQIEVVGKDEKGKLIKRRRILRFLNLDHGRAWRIKEDEAVVMNHERQMPGVRYETAEKILACHKCGSEALIPHPLGKQCANCRTILYALDADWEHERGLPRAGT